MASRQRRMASGFSVVALSGTAALAVACGGSSSNSPEMGPGSDAAAGASSTSGSSSGLSTTPPGSASGSAPGSATGSGSGASSSGEGSLSGSSGSAIPPGSTSGASSGSATGSSGGTSGASSGAPRDAGSLGDGGGACGNKGSGPPFSDTPTLEATSFSNGAVSPYTICTTQSPNFGQSASLNGDPSVKFFWTEVGYNGTRLRRGAEACSHLAFYKEGWYGFQFYLPTPGFPTDKTDGIGQLFSLGGCSSWAAMLHVRNNALSIAHRGTCAPTGATEGPLAADIPRNTWNPIIIHFVVSNQMAGMIEVWFGDAVCRGGAPTYRKAGINFGFGAWTGDALTSVPGNEVGLKFGMYNFDDVNYTAGETRTICYDNVSQLVGNPANAFSIVNPTQ